MNRFNAVLPLPLSRIRWCAAALILCATACGGDDSDHCDTDLGFLTDTDFDSAFPTFTGATVTSGDSVTGPDSFTGPATDTTPTSSTGPATSTTETTSSGSEDTGDTTDTGDASSSSGSDLLPSGSACTSDTECQGLCYINPVLGGICGECTSDSDCEWGCTAPNPFGNPQTGAVCGMGENGDGCETNAACIGQACGEIFAIQGVLEVSTCGECLSDADCTGLCSPTVDFGAFGGSWNCVGPGTLPDGATCDFEGSGSAACGSGFCAVASVQGLIEIGVCSECEEDGDCPGGTCQPPTIDIDEGPAPGTCSN